MNQTASFNIVNKDLVQDCASCVYKSLLFDTLDDSSLSKINVKKIHKQYAKGERICVEGERIEDLIYIHKGLVKLSKRNNDGVVQILSIAQPLDYIGLLSVFSNKIYKYSLTAIEPTSVCFIDIEVIRHSIRTNGDFALEIIEKMSKAADEIIATKVILGKKSLKSKIAFILIYFAKEVYQSNTYTIPISRTEIAELVDMRTENIIRILSSLKKDHIINAKGQNIEILDMEALELINDQK